ncbi:MAG TPA: glycosyltransferase family 39 protein [Prosthecobacter sp.]|nr:glycosyltransferase family 39 protein [Prosthecobacter sp.]
MVPPESKNHWGLIITCAVLFIYGALAVARHSPGLIWDEVRYLGYADRLNHGFYVSDADPDFVNGPGYPIVLTPFVHARLAARLLNAVLMAGAVWFMWLTVRRYAGACWAAAAAALVGFHPTLLWMGFAIMTEPLAIFCLTGFVWAFCAALRGSKPALIGASLLMGWLILTRVFFGHVIMATSVFCLLAWPFLKPWRAALNRTLLIMAGAFLLCVPYLIHTWQKTGQILCWSTNSGELLYWMTSSHQGENGHWFSIEDARDVPEVAARHAAFYEEVYKLPVLTREAVFKAAAMKALKEDPKGAFYNWLCNIVRLAFGFPRSHQPEELRTVVLILVNGPIILFSLIAGGIALRRWRSLPPEIWLLVVFVLFYLGGSTLAPALPRYFVLAVPILLLAMAATFQRHLKISFKPD